MAERRGQRKLRCQINYLPDRHVLQKMSEVYRRLVPGFGVLVAFVALRSLFLGSLENPEPRYTLECYPVIVLLATRLFTK